MTKEKLREHCEKQVKACEMWAKHRGIEPSGKVYEEHKLILDLIKALEQPTVEERKQGEWISIDDGISYQCPYCKNEIIGIEEDLNFCCKCGTKLSFSKKKRGNENEENN